jgi:hypothetical protein
MTRLSRGRSENPSVSACTPIKTKLSIVIYLNVLPHKCERLNVVCRADRDSFHARDLVASGMGIWGCAQRGYDVL